MKYEYLSSLADEDWEGGVASRKFKGRRILRKVWFGFGTTAFLFDFEKK